MITKLEMRSKREFCIILFIPHISYIAGCSEECLDTRHGCIGNGAFISISGATKWCKVFFSGISRAQIYCIAEPYKQATKLMIRERIETKKFNDK